MCQISDLIVLKQQKQQLGRINLILEPAEIILSDKPTLYSYRTSELLYKKYCIRILPGAEGKRRQKVYQGGN